jgi:hypothetical protein
MVIAHINIPIYVGCATCGSTNDVRRRRQPMTLRERVAELLWDRCAITTGQSLEFADSM